MESNAPKDTSKIPVYAAVSSNSPYGQGAASTSDPNPSEQLWDQAYDSLRVSEPALVETYEKILSRELKNGGSSSASDRQNTIEQADRVARRRQMELLVRTGLEKTKREAEVKKGIGDTLQVVLSAKDVVDSAIQAVPQAAVAWAGISFALGVSQLPEAERKDADWSRFS